MGGIHVKLLGLSIENLHGSYNYEVSFNHDVTFIYGSNGCGKTTILNITEAIITGQLFKLFSYSFKRIELRYSKKNNSSISKIVIVEEKKRLNVTFREKEFCIDKIDLPDTRRLPERERMEAIRKYYDMYPFLKGIANIFNYVYLPLNRTYTNINTNEKYYYTYRQFNDSIVYDDRYMSSPSIQDKSISDVETLIFHQYSLINSKLNEISDTFRNQILQSALSVQADFDISSFFTNVIRNKNTVNELEKTKHAYLNILNELNLSSAAAENCELFFSKVLDEYRKITSGGKDGEAEDILSFFLSYSEISKIKNIVHIAEEVEKKKSEVRKPIELFLDTMNDFIGNTEDCKEIKLDSMGQVCFSTKHSKRNLSIHNLSSGEKQLLIFFANLIFKVQTNDSGIFVVDEPELSLHLDWQRIFVEKTMEINPNIQLIFATHAPEIIGRHRNKMFKLVKEYAK